MSARRGWGLDLDPSEWKDFRGLQTADEAKKDMGIWNWIKSKLGWNQPYEVDDAPPSAKAEPIVRDDRGQATEMPQEAFRPFPDLQKVRNRGYPSVEVVGEAAHEANLYRICSEVRSEARLEKWACLVRERSNPKDPSAVAVFIDDLKVGYLARKDAQRHAPFVERQEASKRSLACLAQVSAFWPGSEHCAAPFSVRLDLPPPPEEVYEDCVERIQGAKTRRSRRKAFDRARSILVDPATIAELERTAAETEVERTVARIRRLKTESSRKRNVDEATSFVKELNLDPGLVEALVERMTTALHDVADGAVSEAVADGAASEAVGAALQVDSGNGPDDDFDEPGADAMLDDAEDDPNPTRTEPPAARPRPDVRPSLKSVPGTELSLHTKLDELEFVILDTETTGLRPRSDRLVEVGVVHLGRDREPKLVFDSLLNPERDVGPTSIHGIRAEDVLRAPRFGSVVGELVEHTRHGVWVGHNLPFDTRMLGGELARLGGTVTPGAYICTMQLARQLPLGVKGHRLTWLCEEFGIDFQEAHAAGNDAMATAQLLLRLLELAEKEGMQTLGDMSSAASGALIWQLPQPLPPRADPFPREFARGDALRERATFIQSLVLDLPAPEAGDPELDPAAFSYLDLIDRVLMDRRIDPEEQMLIQQLTRDWQIRRDVAEKVHHHYLRRLVRQAWSDHVLTPAEQEDLELVAGLLAIPSAELQAMSAEEEAQVRVQPIPAPLRGRSHFAGKSVCLTGHFKGPQGVGLPRAEAAALARKHGVQVKDGVSKKVDALVLADPHSQSGKAKKARAYGIELVDEHVFWRDLGLA